MMKKIFASLFVLALVSTMFISCNEDDGRPVVTEASVEFTFSTSNLKGVTSEGLTHVVVTVKDQLGNIVKDNEKVEIYNMNGSYISKPISLLTGSYTLTGFLVLNSDNNIVYAAPIEGSDKAYLVQQPLPIGFEAIKDVVSKVNPEVVSTADSHPEDFGYASFGFNIAETFDFLVGAFIYNDETENFELTTGEITVYSGETLVYSGELQANTDITPDNYDPLGITNKITLPEAYDVFTVNISKSGYTTYNETFTKEELRLYYRNEDNGPLVVILNEGANIPGLVAYYPFNGNANDESGNGNHGTVNGATLTTDRNGNANSAYSFDGTNYISVTNDASICPTTAITVSVWVYAYNTEHRHIWIDKRINFNDYPYNSYFLGTNKIGKIQWETVVTTNLSQLPHVLSDDMGTINTWYHLVSKYDGETLSLYVNGVLVNSENKDGEIEYSNMDLFIGTSARNTNFANGKIDDIRIYDRALTDQEIQALYNE